MLIAGCPATGREWVIRHWVTHLRRAAEYAEQSLYIYCLVPEFDEKTARAVQEACDSNEVELFLERVEEPVRQDRRDWYLEGRYDHMAFLRNMMLGTIRLLEPDFFLSIDSDILIGKKVIANLLTGTSEFSAIGGKVFLSPSSRAWEDHIVNFAKFNSQMNLIRSNANGRFAVDVLMALKLMTHDAYWVDYASHPQGEDIGWSLNAKEAGLRLGWDGSIASKHLMCPEDLHRIDERVGW